MKLAIALFAFSTFHVGVAVSQDQFLSAVLATSQDFSFCGSHEWLYFGDGFCYRVSDANVNWFKAELLCEKAGGQLVSIEEPLDLTTLTSLQFMTGCTDIWTGLVLTEPPVVAADMQNRSFWEFIDPSENGPLLPDVWSHTTMSTDSCEACGYIKGAGEVCPASNIIATISVKNAKCATERKRGICRKPANLRTRYVVMTEPPIASSVATTTATPATTRKPSTMKHNVQCDDEFLGWYDPVEDSRFDVDSLERANCYRKFNHTVDRAAAEEHCSLYGAHLVSIKNKYEEAIVTYLSQCCPIWIGLEWTDDADLCKEPNPSQFNVQWNWVDIALHPKTTCVEYFDWKMLPGNVPDNSIITQSTPPQKDKLCVYLGEGGYWSSDQCITQRQYMCKKQGTFSG